MIKLRLWGTPEEIQKLVAYFETLAPELVILQQSASYSDRGKSTYNRV